jgi:microcompartment protein CcmK/EutM
MTCREGLCCWRSILSGQGERKVLVVIEGRAAAEAVGRKGTPVDAAIIGIVDQVEVDERTGTSINRP